MDNKPSLFLVNYTQSSPIKLQHFKTTISKIRFLSAPTQCPMQIRWLYLHRAVPPDLNQTWRLCTAGSIRFAVPALRQVGFDNVQCHTQVHRRARWRLEKMVSPYLWGHLAWPECLWVGNNVHATKRAWRLASRAWLEAVGQAGCRAQEEINSGMLSCLLHHIDRPVGNMKKVITSWEYLSSLLKS